MLTDQENSEAVKSAVIILGTILIFLLVVAFFSDFLKGFFIIYGHYFAGLLFSIGVVIAIIYKIKVQKIKNKKKDGEKYNSMIDYKISAFMFLILSFASSASSLRLDKDFDKIRDLDPSHQSMAMLENAKLQNNISQASDAHKYTYKISKNDKTVLALIASLSEDSSYSELLNKNFISAKELREYKKRFIESAKISKNPEAILLAKSLQTNQGQE